MNDNVDFMIIGAQKCGTTSLAEQLAAHPDVVFCTEKEPDYFSKKSHPFDESELRAYHELYPNFPSGMKGEASTSYLFCDEYPDTAARLYRYNPDLKLIVMVRDPVARVKSHVYHRLRKSLVAKGDVVHHIECHTDYIERSCYAKQLACYLQYFPREQIHIVVFEEYVKSPEDHVQKTLSFLELESDTSMVIDTEAKNISDAKIRLAGLPGAASLIRWLEKKSWAWRLSPLIPLKLTLPSMLDDYVWKRVSADIEQLEALYGVNVGRWRQNRGKKNTPH
jgi:hypothetical protein